MKSTLLAILFTVSFTATAFSAEGIVLSVKTREVLTMKKISKTQFVKISQVVTGKASLDHFGAKGVRNIMSQDINEGDAQNLVQLEVTGKNILRIIDIRENIDQEVPATINTSLFGSVKKISVDSQTMEALYSESMKKSGLDLLKNLRLLGGALTSKLDISSLNCDADGELLVCRQDANLTINGK